MSKGGRWPLTVCRVFCHDSGEFYIPLCSLCGASIRGCSSWITLREAGVNTAVRVNWLPRVHNVICAARDDCCEDEVAKFVSRSNSSQKGLFVHGVVNVTQLVLLDIAV